MSEKVIWGKRLKGEERRSQQKKMAGHGISNSTLAFPDPVASIIYRFLPRSPFSLTSAMDYEKRRGGGGPSYFGSPFLRPKKSPPPPFQVLHFPENGKKPSMYTKRLFIRPPPSQHIFFGKDIPASFCHQSREEEKTVLGAGGEGRKSFVKSQ